MRKFLWIPLVALLLGTAAACRAEESTAERPTVSYALQSDKIMHASILMERDGAYSVYARLKFEHDPEFADLTEGHVGEWMAITHKGETLTVFFLSSPFDHGNLGFLKTKDKAAALALLEKILP